MRTKAANQHPFHPSDIRNLVKDRDGRCVVEGDIVAKATTSYGSSALRVGRVTRVGIEKGKLTIDDTLKGKIVANVLLSPEPRPVYAKGSDGKTIRETSQQPHPYRKDQTITVTRPCVDHWDLVERLNEDLLLIEQGEVIETSCAEIEALMGIGD